ncbi:MAG: hypothetical protein KR126chlam6_00370 [Candidatus Anoxychlamydiales bacterium]|nr:hypothetical protein [Candidatus Anoxychlamydiales bacterium]
MKAITKYLMIILLFALSTTFANETRAEVGSYKLSKEEIKEMLKQEEKEISISQNNKNPFRLENSYPPLILNHFTHNIIGVSVLGDYLVIEDGSQWKIRTGYAKEAFLWKEDQPILVVKNDSYLSYFHGYRYKMINIKRNTSIEVALNLGPILENQKTLLIAAINPTTCEIILTDNSLWKCDPSQKSLLAKWESIQAIVIGTNKKGWIKSPYDNILINTPRLEEIRATRIE